MNLAEVLIGSNMGSHPDCLGIYVGMDEIYVAQSAKRDGGTVLESLIRVPVIVPDKNQLKPLDLNEAYFIENSWLEALQKVTTKKTWNTNKVVVSLAPEFCLLRHFVISVPLKRQEWAKGIPNEAKKYIHFPFEKAVWAYHAYEFETAATKQQRLGVVFAMTTKTLVSRLERGLKSLGLELVSVEPSCLSLGRAFIDNDKEAVGREGRIYSFFGKEMASFIFLNGTVPLLERDVEISGSIPAERRRFEITNSAEFISKQLERDPFEEAVITGYKMDQWVAALEADSHKPVRKWNLSEIFGIETKSSGELASIGASGKFYDTKVPDLDFAKGKRLSSYEFNASWMVWKITGIVVILLLLFLGNNYMGLLMANYKLKQKQASSSSESLEDFQGLSSSQLQTNLDNIKQQNETLTGIYTNSPFVTPILAAVANSIPADIWLTKISYSSQFPAVTAGSAKLTLEGTVRSGKDGGEDMVIVNKFKETLSQQPQLRRLCRNASISYSSVAGSYNNTAESTVKRRYRNERSGATAAKKESQFVLTCTYETKQIRRR